MDVPPVEAMPTGTGVGVEAPAGQNTLSFPHGAAVGLVDPDGQTNPAAQGPLHEGAERVEELPYLPAGHRVRTPPVQ